MLDCVLLIRITRYQRWSDSLPHFSKINRPVWPRLISTVLTTSYWLISGINWTKYRRKEVLAWNKRRGICFIRKRQMKIHLGKRLNKYNNKTTGSWLQTRNLTQLLKMKIQNFWSNKRSRRSIRSHNTTKSYNVNFVTRRGTQFLKSRSMKIWITGKAFLSIAPLKVAKQSSDLDFSKWHISGENTMLTLEYFFLLREITSVYFRSIRKTLLWKLNYLLINIRAWMDFQQLPMRLGQKQLCVTSIGEIDTFNSKM